MTLRRSTIPLAYEAANVLLTRVAKWSALKGVMKSRHDRFDPLSGLTGSRRDV